MKKAIAIVAFTVCSLITIAAGAAPQHHYHHPRHHYHHPHHRYHHHR